MKYISGNLAVDEEYLDVEEELEVDAENNAALDAKELIKNRARKRRKFDKKAKRKLIKLSKLSGYPAFPVNKFGKYEDDATKVTHYKRIVVSGNNGKVGKYIQRQTNKRVRHLDLEVELKRNKYRKVFDKWWQLY